MNSSVSTLAPVLTFASEVMENESKTRQFAEPANGEVSSRGPHNFSGAESYLDWFSGTKVYFVHTARTAIERALALVGLKPGDEVLAPAYHCGSEVDVLLAAGLKVSLFKVSARGALDLKDLARRITSRTRAVYVIHYFGFAHALTDLAELCRKEGLRLIEDCALSSFTEVDGRRIGLEGHVAVYNFPKFLAVPDGGALAVNDSGLAKEEWQLEAPSGLGVLTQTCRLAKQTALRTVARAGGSRLFASARSRKEPLARSTPDRLEMPPDYYFSEKLSHKGMSRTSCWLMGRTNLVNVRARRRRNYLRLLDLIPAESGIEVLFRELPEGTCPLFFPIVVAGARQWAEKLRAASVPAHAWWCGYHRAFMDLKDFPEASRLKDNLLAVQIHHGLEDKDIESIGRKLRECFSAI